MDSRVTNKNTVIIADSKEIYADARSIIENLYSKLNRLFDTKLSNYAYYKNGDAAVGISGRSGKLCFVEVDRTVLVKDNPSQINSEIKSLLDEAKSLASNYVGMKIKDGDTIYIGTEPKITFIKGYIKTDCRIHMNFEEIEMN